jgi:hypothetical protein
MSKRNPQAVSAVSAMSDAHAFSNETTLRQMSWVLSYPSSGVQDHFKRMLTLAKGADRNYKVRA